MRLRYLHLPRFGPLVDVAVVFGREDLIAKTLDLSRRGSLNFVVGVNGSGKSSLLRALYRTFRALKKKDHPGFPLTLAWDITPSDRTVTCVLHLPEQKNEDPFFVAFPQASSESGNAYWALLTTDIKQNINATYLDQTIERGPNVFGPYLLAHLPKRLIAYTSGEHEPWTRIDHSTLDSTAEVEGQYRTEDERPQGWTMEMEWEEEQPTRVESIFRRYALKSSGVLEPLTGASRSSMESREAFVRLGQELEPLVALRQKLSTNRLPRSERLDDYYFRIDPLHLRFAAIALALWQTAKEMRDRTEEYQREALRNLLLQSNDKPIDARRVLNEVDWFWPTHLSLTYWDIDDRVSPRQHQELLCLIALADEVIAQPLGRQRAVFSLGPSDRINLNERLKDIFPLGLPSEQLELIAGRVDGCKTGAEAILRVLSADKDVDSTPMDVFSRFRAWSRTGLLEDISLTVKRLHRPASADGETDDIIIAYDQLSDGEQMLLGRMGLIFLLRGQGGSLLLLDEPETHFNDVWKREIVEMIDLGLLDSTNVNVIVATHTGIALTDAFAAEVTVLDTNEGKTVARSVSGGLFGTDPGEVAVNLFGADSSIGSRSLQALNRLLKTDWAGRENELEAIIALLGSSFHRAELRAILRRLRDNGAPSH
jgi:predicted ATPase